MIPQGMLYGARAGGFSDGGQFRNRSAEQYNTQSGNPYLPIFNTARSQMMQSSPQQMQQPVGLQQALQGMQINGGPMQQQQAMPVMPQLARPVSGVQGRNVVMPAQHGFYGGWGNIRAMLAQLAQQGGGYA